MFKLFRTKKAEADDEIRFEDETSYVPEDLLAKNSEPLELTSSEALEHVLIKLDALSRKLDLLLKKYGK